MFPEEIYFCSTTQCPQLKEDVRSFGMDSVCNLQAHNVGWVQNWKRNAKGTYPFPTLSLCVGVDARDIVAPSCIMGDNGGFRDEQASRYGTALSIVRCLLGSGNMGIIRSEASHRGKDNAVLEGYPADSDGLEQRRHLPYRGYDWC